MTATTLIVREGKGGKMADITQIINNFKDAVKGKEVRGSLVDLAEKINSEAEDATVIATSASADVAKSIKEVNTAIDNTSVVIQAAEKVTAESKAVTTEAEDINSKNEVLYQELKKVDVAQLKIKLDSVESEINDVIDRIDLTGLTINLDTITLSTGSPRTAKYICRTDGGTANITGDLPVKQAFILDVELLRYASTTDYVTRQTLTLYENATIRFRTCRNGVWSNWRNIYDSTGLPPSNTAPRIAGTASAGVESTYSRGDHAHPVQTTVSGNAGTATKLQIARTINGVEYDGTKDIFVPLTDASTISINSAFTRNSRFTASNLSVHATGRVVNFNATISSSTAGTLSNILLYTITNTDYLPTVASNLFAINQSTGATYILAVDPGLERIRFASLGINSTYAANQTITVVGSWVTR